MASYPTELTPELYDYLLAQGVREPAILARLREETAREELAIMQIAPEQGQFMALLVELLGVRRYLEVGVFTGYSSLAVALAMPEDGRITALDVSEDWTAVARRYWHEAGVAGRIELRLADAADSLAALLAEGRADRYDFAFIDADKTGYDTYYEQCLKLVRPGGLIAIDNVFQDGRVLDPGGSASATAVYKLNRKIRGDGRVSIVMLPLGDGLTLCRKRIR